MNQIEKHWRGSRFVAALALLVVCGPTLFAEDTKSGPAAQTVARCGKGWLETIEGYPVLHLKGTPYEMGYQHGALLRDHCRQNMKSILVDKAGSLNLVEVGPLKVTPRTAIDMIVAIQQPHVAGRYFEEMEGLAAGSGQSVADVRAGNFVPELFHCSGFALAKTATKNGNMLHGRVLDYAIDWGLQDHAVVIVYEPEGRLPWVNVSYAGFIGSVTGMNAEHISVGEMGGKGLGHWNGRPMALLVRDALETAKSLDEAIATFRDGPRTCQYYYVLADGETNNAVGMEASWDVFTLILPGESHPMLSNPVKDCVLMSAGDRYQELSRQTTAGHGKFTIESALHLMDRPIAMESNLHNVLFEPATTRFWVANASSDKKPAAEQKYSSFQLSELLNRKPDSNSPELLLPQRTAGLPSEKGTRSVKGGN
ncbi:C45 family autoproteolytic acyltransferase/hydolase [Schlesneria paludicola]|uniref:C45 family autoproteolytic acyltransferase/hydolase n=1 Tax=Schlesneria paludicola TaxID=360056 RepID=UPI00029A0E39|nr:C45 family peptidase [Schlesneria paludicola]